MKTPKLISALFSLALFQCSSNPPPETPPPSHATIGGTGGFQPKEAESFTQQQTVDKYKDCGFNEQQPFTATRLTQTLNSGTIAVDKAAATGIYKFLGSNAQQFGVELKFTATKAPLNKIGEAQSELDSKINANVQMNVSPIQSWPQLYQQADPKVPVRCGIMAISSLGNAQFGQQPFPYGVNPFISRARAMYEFGSSPSFQRNINGTSGTTTFSVSKENVTLAGRSIQAEYAIRVAHDFGSHAQVRSLGLAKSTIYYVSNQRFIAVSVETGDGRVPVANFFP